MMPDASAHLICACATMALRHVLVQELNKRERTAKTFFINKNPFAKKKSYASSCKKPLAVEMPF